MILLPLHRVNSFMHIEQLFVRTHLLLMNLPFSLPAITGYFFSIGLFVEAIQESLYGSNTTEKFTKHVNQNKRWLAKEIRIDNSKIMKKKKSLKAFFFAPFHR